MDRILYVNACVRPQSRTRRLAEAALAKNFYGIAPTLGPGEVSGEKKA